MSIQQLIEELWAFVESPGNERIKWAVNPSILPFRGHPFGLKGELDERLGHARQIYSWQMDQKLQEVQSIDVLWFGSNPNSPDSLHRLLWGEAPREWRKPKQKIGEQKGFDEFEREYAALSGRQNPRRMPVSATAWDPIQDAKRGWLHYKEALQKSVDLQRVVMANAIPWGSRTLDELLDVLFEFDKELLARMLVFSDRLINGMIEALNPKLVIVPLSLARNNTLGMVVDELLKKKLIKEDYPLRIKKEGGTRQSKSYVDGTKDLGHKYRTRNFYYYVEDKLDGPRRLYVPHPSSLRIAKGAAADFQTMLANLIRANLKND